MYDFQRRLALLAGPMLALSVALASAQAASAGDVAPPSSAKIATGAPAPLVVLFKTGSSDLRPEDRAVLDRASRAYNEGHPIVMILTGSADSVGGAEGNLTLSARRANAVLKGLVDRGIPVDRFQILAKGETEPSVATKQGVAEPRNRSVEISWH